MFVLREVFDTPYDEIAAAVGRSEAAVRQIAHRAREHVAAGRRRMAVSKREHLETVERFLAATRDGDIQGLMEILAPDVVLVSDGGGVAPAARRPIEGAARVAALLVRGARVAQVDANVAWLNGSPAIRIEVEGKYSAAISLAIDGGRVTRIFAVSNPHKLARVDSIVAVTRA